MIGWNAAAMGKSLADKVWDDHQRQVSDVGFSVEELQYLLSVAPGSSADRSADLLNVAPVPSVDETIVVGGATLLSRGQLEFIEGGQFQPVDHHRRID